MRKIILNIIAVFIILSSCEDVLDKEPLGIIADNAVWNDENLMDAFLTGVYYKTTILLNETPVTVEEDHNRSEFWNGPYIVNEMADEAMRGWIQSEQWRKLGYLDENGGLLEWWENSYTVIRSLNEFIEKVPNSGVDPEYIKKRVAEARFLRAYNYFAMVKRYGGVPLITVAQSLDTPEEELYRARDTEEKVYNFILTELDEIANDLPPKNEFGRPGMYAAYALKSRAALYAGSIAQFGEYQLDGVVGIEKTKANFYYQQAAEASKTVINSGEYSLYNQNPDKVQNFKDIFLVHQNSEVIWTREHNTSNLEAGGNGWTWDFFQCPKPQAWGAGNQTAPYLEMADEFELIDGTSGVLDREAIKEGTWTHDKLWANKEPRFFATIWTHGTPWKGETIDWHSRLKTPEGDILTSGSYNGVLAQGYHYIGRTSFGVMKYLDEKKDNMGWRGTSGTSWIIFRYAEMLLNYAEAAYELGETDSALDAINQIRSRAGVALRTDIDREDIRHERKIELAFEGHRYWDLRRWRTAVNSLTRDFHGLLYTLDYNSGEYLIDVINVHGTVEPCIFRKQNYYLPITPRRIANNNNLVENPYY